jgi:REP element-mobilizing transposase RayT
MLEIISSIKMDRKKSTLRRRLRPLKKMRQIELRFRTWGGRRKNAGRKRCGPKMVSHRTRPDFHRRFPLHVTLRMRRDVKGMRTQQCFKAIEKAFWAGGNKFGLSLVHFAVMNDHIHMMVEAAGKESLSSGMHALNIRVARAVNRAQRRRGTVLADHYHADVLRTPSHVSKVRNYLLGNAAKHYGLMTPQPDPFTSIAALHKPQTWLLNTC